MPPAVMYLAVFSGAILVIATSSTMIRLAGLLVIGVAVALSSVEQVKRALITAIALEIPLQIDIFLNQDPLALSDLNGFNLSLTTVCLGVLYLLWAAERAAQRSSTDRGLLRAVLPALAYLAVCSATILVAIDPTLSIYQINVLAQSFLLLLYVVHWARTRENILFLTLVILSGVFLQTALAVVQQYTGSSFEIGPIKALFIDGRSSGTLKHGNRLGAYAAMMLGPALGLSLTRGVPRSYRIYGVASLLAAFLALLLSGSRGGLVGAGVALVLATVLALRSGWLSPRVVVAGGVVVALLFLTQLDVLGARLERGVVDDPNVIGRVRLLELSVALIARHPIFGVGANNFALSLPEVVTIDYAGVWLATVHNKYALVWVETGFIGLAAFLFFLGSVLRRSWRVYRNGDGLTAPLGMGFMCGVVAMLVHMNFDKFADRANIQMLWLFAGVVYALHRVATSRPRVPIRLASDAGSGRAGQLGRHRP